MTARIVPRATTNEILAFLKAQGVSLSDEGIRLLKKMLEEEPVGKPTLERSKIMARNPIFMQILDHMLVNRSNRIQKIADNNPLVKLIDEKRKTIIKDSPEAERPMPDHLRRVFFDEPRWQPFFPFLAIPPQGQIIKVVELAYPDQPYIGFLHPEGGRNVLYSTRRKIDYEQLPKEKYFRLKEGVFQYEIDEVMNLEKGYYEYIMSFHK